MADKIKKETTDKKIGHSATSKALFDCYFCDAKFSLKQQLIGHETTKHKHEDYVGKTTIKTEKYKNCTESTNNHCIEEKTNRLPESLICDESLYSEDSLKVYSQNHAKVEPFICTESGTISTSKGWLNRHIETHTVKKSFKCLVCGLLFTQKLHLAIHIQSHEKEKQLRSKNGRGEIKYCEFEAGEKSYPA